MARRRFGGRTLARSQAMQLLFQAEATGRSVDDVLSGTYALSDGPLDDYAELLARGADGMRPDLDAVMNGVSPNWGVARMPAVDRNLLRVSLYEMLCVDDIDPVITIDECVELAKAYGTDESFRFANGLLGTVAAQLADGVDVIGGARSVAPSSEQDEACEPSLAAGDAVVTFVEGGNDV